VSGELWVLPDLAVEIGLDEAIVLYRVHQLAALEEHRAEGIKRTWAEWREDFPFWPAGHVRNTLTTLRVLGLVAGRTPASPEARQPIFLTETGRLTIAEAMRRAQRPREPEAQAA
jgi:hypothetical protein